MYGRKHCEKRRNCLLQAISPFLTMFSTAIYLYCVKMRYCVVIPGFRGWDGIQNYVYEVEWGWKGEGLESLEQYDIQNGCRTDLV